MSKHLIAGVCIKENDKQLETILDKNESLISRSLKSDRMLVVHSNGDETKFDKMLQEMNDIKGIEAKKMVFID